MNLIEIKQINGLQSVLESLGASIDTVNGQINETLSEHYELIGNNKEKVDKLVVEKNTLADQGVSGTSFRNGLGYPGVESLEHKRLTLYDFEEFEVSGEAVPTNDEIQYSQWTGAGQVDNNVTSTISFTSARRIIHTEESNNSSEIKKNPWVENAEFKRTPIRNEDGYITGYEENFSKAEPLIPVETTKTTTRSRTFGSQEESVNIEEFSELSEQIVIPQNSELTEFNGSDALSNYEKFFSADLNESRIMSLALPEDIGIFEVNSGEMFGPTSNACFSGLIREKTQEIADERYHWMKSVLNEEYYIKKAEVEYLEGKIGGVGGIGYTWNDIGVQKAVIKWTRPNPIAEGQWETVDYYVDWYSWTYDGVEVEVDEADVIELTDVEDIDIEVPDYKNVNLYLNKNQMLAWMRETYDFSRLSNYVALNLLPYETPLASETPVTVNELVYSEGDFPVSFWEKNDSGGYGARAYFDDVFEEMKAEMRLRFGSIQVVMPEPFEGREIYVVFPEMSSKVEFTSNNGSVEGRESLIVQGEGGLRFFGNGNAWYVAGSFNHRIFSYSGKFFNPFKNYSEYPSFYEVINSNNYDGAFDLTDENQIVGVRTDELTVSQVDINLPDPYRGEELIIKDEGLRAGNLPIVISAGDYAVEGRSQITINSDGGSVYLYADGKDWWLLDEKGVDYEDESIIDVGTAASEFELDDKSNVRYELIDESNYSPANPSFEYEEKIDDTNYANLYTIASSTRNLFFDSENIVAASPLRIVLQEYGGADTGREIVIHDKYVSGSTKQLQVYVGVSPQLIATIDIGTGGKYTFQSGYPYPTYDEDTGFSTERGHLIKEFSSIVGIKSYGFTDNLMVLRLPKPFGSKIIRIRDEYVYSLVGKTLTILNNDGTTLVDQDALGKGFDYEFKSDGKTWSPLASASGERVTNYVP